MPTIPVLKKKRDYKNSSNRRKERQKIYQDKRWKELRDQYIKEHPLCERCLDEGKTVPAQEIHHVVSFQTALNDQEKEELAFDYNNLMALCSKCHKEIHNQKGEKKW